MRRSCSGCPRAPDRHRTPECHRQSLKAVRRLIRHGSRKRGVRLRSMAAGDDPCRAVLGAVIVEKSQGSCDVAWSLGRQIAVQLLLAAIGKGLAAFHMGEEEPFADQLTCHRQYWVDEIQLPDCHPEAVGLQCRGRCYLKHFVLPACRRLKVERLYPVCFINFLDFWVVQAFVRDVFFVQPI